ncbi:MAG: DUF177 domain-containing protein [Kofleriaceae bacterium]|jgi:uncharacterized protein|nr:DUF177 domain-containing protein [Kofleriaceae bacterium]MBP6837584.1 DUF177 domain-containing protein [Kofleriaceae bacterium]
MVESSPYTVDVRELPCHRHLDVPGVFVAKVLAGLPLRDALEAPAEDPAAGALALDIDLHVDGTSVFVTGKAAGHVVVGCGRCVGPVRIAITEALRVTFMPRSELADDTDAAASAGEGDDDPGQEVAGADLDLFPYDGETIDLEPLIRELLVLAVPYAPLCREDCQGLCPQCGTDRNTQTCQCQRPVDPRFAALAGLKLPS